MARYTPDSHCNFWGKNHGITESISSEKEEHLTSKGEPEQLFWRFAQSNTPLEQFSDAPLSACHASDGLSKARPASDLTQIGYRLARQVSLHMGLRMYKTRKSTLINTHLTF